MNNVIALAGNPNCGKTTMYNKLTGASQHVGNWPGVTVEKKEGRLKGVKDALVVDLPGIYSLSPYSPEEVVSRDYLLRGEADVILDLVDGTNMERNLYLTTQLLEVGLPVVVALNMADLMRKNGMIVDIGKLKGLLGCEVVETSALKNTGLDTVAERALELAEANTSARPPLNFSAEVEAALAEIALLVGERVPAERKRWYSIKLFERDQAMLEEMSLSMEMLEKLEGIIQPLEERMDDDSESIIISERYEMISEIMNQCVKVRRTGLTTSDKIDRIVTNRWLALPIFVAIMFGVYYVSIMTIGDLVTGWTNDVLFGELIGGNVGALMEAAGAAGWASSLVVDGIIGGVGAVIGFVPQMAILFVMLVFLEDCGYMARIAFIMDRVFRRFGLSGKSFIPLLVGSGCGVPGIMATKTIENEKDRRMTVITTTFIPCGAKLPIIGLIASTILGGVWWVAPLVYFAGIASVVITGIILKKTRMFAGEPAPFVMELPQYHWPEAKTWALHVWERVRSFIIKAGTVIFISSIVVWFLLSFGFENGVFGMVGVENSFFAIIGSAIAPVFAPLGFGTWEGVVGTLTGLVAKENLVSTLAIIQGLSGAALEGVLDDPMPMATFMTTMLPTMAAGLSFLIFNMLCAPCFAAIGAIRRQMNSAKWTAFAVAYQTIYAYCIALMVFQFGSWFGTGAFTAGTVVAIVILAAFIYLLFRRAPKPEGQLRRASARA